MERSIRQLGLATLVAMAIACVPLVSFATPDSPPAPGSAAPATGHEETVREAPAAPAVEGPVCRGRVESGLGTARAPSSVAEIAEPLQVGSPCCVAQCEATCGVGEPCACTRCIVLGCGL